MKKLCETYFKYLNDTINGYKVVEENGSFNIYTYTSCKKFNNWQLFLSYNSLDKVVNYFRKKNQRYIEELSMDIEWNRLEAQWVNDTFQKISKIL